MRMVLVDNLFAATIDLVTVLPRLMLITKEKLSNGSVKPEVEPGVLVFAK